MRCTVMFYIILYLHFLSKSLSTKKSEIRRIISGRDANESKYPYIVKLQAQLATYKGDKIVKIQQRHSCTASVLTPTWTLTAAHCYLKENLFDEEKDITIKMKHLIRYGSYNDNNTFSMVTDFITHPSFKLRPADMFNDIAMIKHKPISLNQYACVSGLDYVTMIGQEVTLFGYGLTTKLVNLKNKTSSYSSVEVDDATTLGKPLQFLDGLVVQCDELNDKFKPVMCIARRCGKVSSMCPGDSGGPVLHDSGVVGVISGGTLTAVKFCLLEPVPPFYDEVGVTPTSPYIDWISSLIRNEVPKQHLTTEAREYQ